jgi:hypothetical protein
MKSPVPPNNGEPSNASANANPSARPDDRRMGEEKFPISGPIGRAPGAVSAAVRQEAKALHALIFGDKATRRRNDAPLQEEGSKNSNGATEPWHPYAEGDSNILVGGKGRVKLDDLLTKALAPIGYVRVEKLTYRANWSTDDVEQFLSFDTYGNPKQFLSSDAGLRNPQAEAFAMQCRERYVGRMYFRDMPEGGYVFPHFFCPVHFDAGTFCSWKPRGSLNIPDFSPSNLSAKVVSELSAKLIPLVSAIRSSADLLKFLSNPDMTASPYIQMGDYYRAAQIAFLARKLGRPRAETQTILRGFTIGIRRGIDTDRFTPESYIERILDDADAAFAEKAG